MTTEATAKTIQRNFCLYNALPWPQATRERSMLLTTQLPVLLASIPPITLTTLPMFASVRQCLVSVAGPWRRRSTHRAVSRGPPRTMPAAFRREPRSTAQSHPRWRPSECRGARGAADRSRLEMGKLKDAALILAFLGTIAICAIWIHSGSIFQ